MNPIRRRRWIFLDIICILCPVFVFNVELLRLKFSIGFVSHTLLLHSTHTHTHTSPLAAFAQYLFSSVATIISIWRMEYTLFAVEKSRTADCNQSISYFLNSLSNHLNAMHSPNRKDIECICWCVVFFYYYEFHIGLTSTLRIFHIIEMQKLRSFCSSFLLNNHQITSISMVFVLLLRSRNNKGKRTNVMKPSELIFWLVRLRLPCFRSIHINNVESNCI